MKITFVGEKPLIYFVDVTHYSVKPQKHKLFIESENREDKKQEY